MRSKSLIVLFAVLPASLALWSCTSDAECSSLAGAECREGSCECPAGTQSVLGGTLCAQIAPYYTSPCHDDHQCSGLTTAFQCRRENTSDQDSSGRCFCQPGHHYFLGRCWPTSDFGAACARDEHCMGATRDPYSLVCRETCRCADGYYERQRGECRRVGIAIGDECVLDEDCQFHDGACDINSFTCYNINDVTTRNTNQSQAYFEPRNETRQAKTSRHLSPCELTCDDPYVCSEFGVCVCPRGYYDGGNGDCLAELGSPALAEAECAGMLAVVRNGVCTCPANFFFEENMRDCTKVSRRLSDACITDSACHTFGAATRCGAPQSPWGIRYCECLAEEAVWDEGRQMCRLFVGIGEHCAVDNDCLAGSVQIPCVQGVCSCPDGTAAIEGLCLATGLSLGDACQVSQECTATPNTVCEGGRCACDATGYQEVNGVCAPIIGGVCHADTDCVIENTLCVEEGQVSRCQCGQQLVAYEEVCWPVSSGFGSSCNVSAQCTAVMGDTAACAGGRCVCADNHHYRDDRCWPMTGLFEPCARSSECYLADLSQRVVCRNSQCQCQFHYPYSEELNTCTSSARTMFASVLLLSTTLILLFLR